MTKEPRWKLRFESFEKALASLLELTEKKETIDDIIIDATIQRFEVTFELAWKTLQDYLFYSGIDDFKGPKNVINKAFQDNLLTDGQIWLDMLNDRNILSHEYAFEESRNIHKNILESYVIGFRELFERLKNE
jgi:nucleotidyltransferase substrate binding protein (TIGR01987 family)